MANGVTAEDFLAPEGHKPGVLETEFKSPLTLVTQLRRKALTPTLPKNSPCTVLHSMTPL